MANFIKKIVNKWHFWFHNTTVRKGEKGGFKWVFKRFTVDFSTISGNFKARFTAAEHPYAYLLAGKDDDNIHGYCAVLYEVGMLLTTDQEFVNDIETALVKYNERIAAAAKVVDDEDEEKIAIEEEKALQAYAEMPKRHRKKADREIDKKFRKAVKDE